MTREVPVRVQHLGERRRAESRAQQEGEVALARTPPHTPDSSRVFAEGLRQLPSWGAGLPTLLVLWMRALRRRE